jgi:hypothetical protein
MSNFVQTTMLRAVDKETAERIGYTLALLTSGRAVEATSFLTQWRDSITPSVELYDQRMEKVE